MKVGVMGAGWVARHRHLPSLLAIPDVEVVAVYDRNHERARSLATEYGIDLVARERDELLGAGLDAAVIATSPWSHAEHSTAALAAGLHVFCEKPMALDSGEARAMAAAAAAANRILTVSHNFLFARSSVLARKYFGPDPDLLLASAVQLSSDRRRLPTWYAELPGGLLFDEVPHLLYTLRAWCGSLHLAAAHATWREDGQPAVVQARFEGAVPAQATMTFGAPLSEWHVSLVGRRRAVDLDLFRDIAIRVGSDGEHHAVDIARTSAKVMVDHATGFIGSGLGVVRGSLRWGHGALIAAFVEAARNTHHNPVPLEDALAVVEMTDDILRAIGATEHGLRTRATGV